MYLYVCMHVCMYVCVYIYLSLSIYIYIYSFDRDRPRLNRLLFPQLHLNRFCCSAFLNFQTASYYTMLCYAILYIDHI